MRRLLVVLVAVGLLAPASASARPWLTMHRAERAANAYSTEDTRALIDRAADCRRLTRTRVACDINGFPAPGDPGGPIGWFDENATGSPDDTIAIPVFVTLSRGVVRVRRA